MTKDAILKSARELCQKRRVDTSKANDIYKAIQDRAITLTLLSLLPLSIFEFFLLIFGVNGMYSKINNMVNVPFWRGRLHILTSSFIIQFVVIFIAYLILGILDLVPGINIFFMVIAMGFNYYIVRSYGYLYVKSLLLLDESTIKDTDSDKRAGLKVIAIFVAIIAIITGGYFFATRTTFNSRDYKKMGAPKECVISDYYTRIKAGTFSDCDELHNITLPNSIKAIGFYAFESCDGLTSVVLPNSIRKIKPYAFRGCDRLEYIKLPSNLKVISSYMFMNCDVLSEIVFPENLKIIKKCAFQNCDGIVDIVLPDGLEEIHHDAFRGCAKLRSITIPSSVVKVEAMVFFNSRKLETIRISPSSPVYSEMKSRYKDKIVDI